MSTVSVVIRVRNNPRQLGRAIDSLRRHAPRAEVVVVDNGSIDDTLEVATSLADSVLVHPGSLIEMRSAGVNGASGDLVFFLDSDQQVIEGTIEDACRTAADHEAVVVPERPLVSRGPWFRTLAAERMWAEASGLGIARMFWRDVYLRYHHPVGVRFGDDRAVSAQAASVGMSRVPVLHDEIASPIALFRKYYEYGRSYAPGAGTLVAPSAAFRAHILAAPRMGMRSMMWLAPVMAVKAGKATAFYLGTARAGSA